jgi:predicted dehydrogenase
VDVDERNLDRAAAKHPHARKYTDFRRLFDDAKTFDAVVVSTTEHTHAPATMLALKAGKHVYCEKPLAHSVWETHVVTEATSRRATVRRPIGICGPSTARGGR